MIGQKMCDELLDGCMTDYKNYIGGCYKGFHITIDFRKPVYIVYINATPSNEAGKAMLESFLVGHKSNVKYISKTESKEHTVKLRIVEPKPKKNLSKVLNDAIKPVITELLNCKYHSGCINCGENADNLSCYEIYGFHHYICDDCVPEVESNLQARQQDILSTKSNVALGTTGAIVGGLLGALVWIFMYNTKSFTDFYWLAGYVLVLFAFQGYEKLGGHIDKKGFFISLGVVLVMPFIANHFAWIWSAFDLQKVRGYSLGQYLFFRDILRDYKMTHGYFIDLAIGYGATALLGTRYVYRMFKKSIGSYTYKKMDK